MRRRRITQIFPWLLPIRKKQRMFCFYLNMKIDGKKYAKIIQDERLPYPIIKADSTLYNYETGFDMKYQENKVFNLKLAAKTMDGLLINPGETFSFWKLVHYADKQIPYRDGLVVVNGKLTTSYGGGLCQISNLLFWLFLHTPLTIMERHGHSVKDFPDPKGDTLVGVDATVADGWFDLKIKNNTDSAYQIKISFDEEKMYGEIVTNQEILHSYEIKNGDIHYETINQEVFQKADVMRYKIDTNTGECMQEELLYQNKCKIGYPLQEEITQKEEEENNMKKIAILFGGCSSEYEVSLQSAYGIIKNIDKTKYEPILIGINQEGQWFLYEGEEEAIPNNTWQEKKEIFPVVVSNDKSLHGIYIWRNGMEKGAQTLSLDAALPVLHGRNGEDGTVQGALELANIPVIGCNTLSSAVCMDKDMAHRLVKEAGILVPKSKLITNITMEKEKTEVFSYVEEIGYPVFVKPLRAGSSFGITKVDKKEMLEDALTLAFTYDTQVVIEEGINGVEVGCAVMGMKELTIGSVDEIELSDGFFDYTEKYTLKSSKIHVPARISDEKELEIKQIAKTIYNALGCSCFARVDLFLTANGNIYFNEVNTIPGFTEHSRFPNMMKHAGIEIKEVVNSLIEMVV